MFDPLYYPTSAGGGVQRVAHMPVATFRGVGGVIEHPMQRLGLAPAGASRLVGVHAAADLPVGLSGGLPAARVILPVPPIVGRAGDPSTDPNVML